VNRLRPSRRTVARAARAATRPRSTSARVGSLVLAHGGDLLGDLIQRLPDDVVAHVKSRLRPVGRLDYGPVRIDMRTDSAWQIFRLGSCAKEPETVRWLETQLRPGDTLYDIGANVGAYSLVAFAITAGQAKVVAFEPGFATFTALCHNIQLNRAADAIVPLPIALSDADGLATFRYSDTDAGAALHSWQEGVPGEAHAPQLVLPTMTFTLDGRIEALHLPPPTLIKLDVDGPELEVLAGADKALSRPELRGVLVELDDRTPAAAEAVALLEGKGFRVESRHVRGGIGAAGPIQNVIFARG
jgi:FkbM family methyltransferase